MRGEVSQAARGRTARSGANTGTRRPQPGNAGRAQGPNRPGSAGRSQRTPPPSCLHGRAAALRPRAGPGTAEPGAPRRGGGDAHPPAPPRRPPDTRATPRACAAPPLRPEATPRTRALQLTFTPRRTAPPRPPARRPIRAAGLRRAAARGHGGARGDARLRNGGGGDPGAPLVAGRPRRRSGGTELPAGPGAGAPRALPRRHAAAPRSRPLPSRSRRSPLSSPSGLRCHPQPSRGRAGPGSPRAAVPLARLGALRCGAELSGAAGRCQRRSKQRGRAGT